MSVTTDHQATTAQRGFESLEDETRIDGLPVRGPLPPWLTETLAAAGVAYEAPGVLTTAHPHRERDTSGMLNYAAQLGARNSYRFFRLRPGAASPELLAAKPVREPAYMHSFGLTPRWLVLAE